MRFYDKHGKGNTTMSLYHCFRPLIFTLPEESAHHTALIILSCGLIPGQSTISTPALQQTLWDLAFPNPVGLAAGFDKNALAIKGLLAQGFGFIETGTVTPKPQEGNPKPRMFRLEQDHAVINRLGFNNAGIDAYMERLKRWKDQQKPGIIGVNIGKNRDQDNAAADYVALLQRVYPLADYVTINISSPNTPGLRDLQHENALDNLLETIANTRNQLQKQHVRRVPILVKIAPDLGEDALATIVSVTQEHDMDGLIVSNTTLRRDHLKEHEKSNESGGLSGNPLFDISTRMLRQAYRLTDGKLPLVGVGGISSASDAYAKIRAGASLVQLYTGLIYEGFGLVRRINLELLDLLQRDGFRNINDAVGTDTR